MSWIKILGYSLLAAFFYSFVCLITSLSPIFFNIIGIGISNEEFLAKQQNYYFNAPMRSIIQGNAGCVRADSVLGYSQKPGDCIFENFEFKTVLKFDMNGSVMSNSKKDKSKIIVVGDSHAMGWGVSYNETFSYLLSSAGYDITNLSMSSYGTEQEILSALTKDDFDRKEIILIQYCNNDLDKNKQILKDYVDNEFTQYSGRVPTEFSLHSKLHNAARLFLKGFNFRQFYLFPIKVFFDAFNASENPPQNSTAHKAEFIKVLSKYPRLKDKKIIVFYSNGHGQKNTGWNETIGNINFIDLDLERKHYHMIDDHLNKSGHEYIAQRLKKILINN
jgi:hypothetical protein